MSGIAKKLTFEYVKNVFSERGFVLLDTEYTNSETPMSYLCLCGTESKMSYKNVKKGRSCAECGKKKLSTSKTKYDIEFIRKYFEKSGYTLVSTQYNADKLDYTCSCGKESSIAWRHALHHGIGCRSCGHLKIGEAKRKYSIEDVKELFAKQGKVLLENEFKNSLTPMRYICKCGNKSTMNLNNFFKGKDCYDCRNNKISESMKDPNLTDEERILRRSLRKDKAFRTGVYVRDNYTCQCCGERGGEINAHHIFNFADNPEIRTDIDNGITLCIDCHVDFHKQYGKRNTTDEHLAEFIAGRAS